MYKRQEYVLTTDYEDGFALVEETQNVVTTRTFSKIYGLAALRLGWAYCPAPIAAVINRLRGPFNVSTPAQLAGIAAIEDQAHVQASIKHNDEWRDRLFKQKTAYEIGFCLVGSEMCIRDRRHSAFLQRAQIHLHNQL